MVRSLARQHYLLAISLATLLAAACALPDATGSAGADAVVAQEAFRSGGALPGPSPALDASASVAASVDAASLCVVPIGIEAMTSSPGIPDAHAHRPHAAARGARDGLAAQIQDAYVIGYEEL